MIATLLAPLVPATRIEFSIGGEPRPRPRARARAMHVGRGKYIGQVYHPDPSDERAARPDMDEKDREWYRSAVWYRLTRRAVAAHLPEKPWDGPIAIDIKIFLPRPAYMCDLRKFPPGKIYAPERGTGDDDNFEKGIWDALSHKKEKRDERGKVIRSEVRGVYWDDSQICDNRCRKWYHAVGAAPGAIVVLEPLCDPDKEESCLFSR